MKINKVAILGSGVMGGQIAGVFANANIPTLLFDYQDYLNDNIKKIAQFKPAALTQATQQDWITPCSFEHDLAQLSSCDLVIEVIIEDLKAKQTLFKNIIPHLNDEVILASNTSSLSINQLGANLGKLGSRFCGIHFFNPPRYMTLVELIPTKQTQANLLQDLEGFLTTQLGKNILYSQDRAGFIANRIGVFSIATCIYHAERLRLDFDTVDALTGTLLKRPKSATFRTADLVGLDIVQQVFAQFYQQHSNDPWRDYFKPIAWLDQLVSQQHLGQKTKKGIYTKAQGVINVYQANKQTYRQANNDINPEIKTIFTQEVSRQLLSLKDNCHPQAQFIYSILKDISLYASYHLKEIGQSTRDIDWALRWGYGWTLGIFEYWQMSGVKKTNALFFQNTTEDKKADWLDDIDYFYSTDGAYVPADGALIPYSNHPAYRHQLYRPTLFGEASIQYGQTIFENQSVRCWHEEDGLVIVSLKTKLHTLSIAVIQSLKQAIELAQANYQALIIYQDQAPFCAGANLYEILATAKLNMINTQSLLTKAKQKAWHLLKPDLPSIDHLIPISEVLALLQDTLMLLKYSTIPTIAVVEGLALGGGCELLLHCDKVVAHRESYIGLVEVGVGLLPAGGGCKEMARRASQADNVFPTLAKYITQIGTGKVSSSAQEAKQMGYLTNNDVIINQRLDLLYTAKEQAKIMINHHYRPDNPQQSIAVAGTTAKANIMAQLTNMKVGHFISDYDYVIVQKIADVLCGGRLPPKTKVDSQYYLNLERTRFIELLTQTKTQDRIQYMLTKHKPLRN